MSAREQSWSSPAGFVPLPSAIEGIEMYGPPQERAPDDRTRSFRCPSCGGVFEYSPAEQELKCPYCGHSQEIDAHQVGRSADEFEFTLATMERAKYGWGTQRKELVCDACGAVVAAAADDLTSTCAFCGSTRVHARDTLGDMLRPTSLIPFTIDRATCKSNVIEWLGRGWMHPPELREVKAMRELTGVYLPFWTFDARVRADWKAEVGTVRVERYRSGGEWKTRTVIDWRWEAGTVSLTVDDQQVPGTGRVSEAILRKAAPYGLASLVDYDPKYLAGWHAKGYDVQLQNAWRRARGDMRDRAQRACYEDTGSSHVRNFQMNVDFADERWRYVLLPAYLITYSLDNRTFQVLVNGQSGKVAGQKPVDWSRVWLAIVAMLAPGAAVGLLGLVTLPFGGIGAVGLFLGLILFVAALVGAAFVFRSARASEEV
jgi:Zn finger protein HypA/HybF involved in hydrogenase expression